MANDKAYENLNYMFYGCESLDAPNMNFQSISDKVKYMDSMFYGAGAEGSTTFDGQKSRMSMLSDCDEAFTNSRFAFNDTKFQLVGYTDSESVSVNASNGRVSAKSIYVGGEQLFASCSILNASTVENAVSKGLSSVEVVAKDGDGNPETEIIPAKVSAVGRLTASASEGGIVGQNHVLTINDIVKLNESSVFSVEVYSTENIVIDSYDDEFENRVIGRMVAFDTYSPVELLMSVGEVVDEDKIDMLVEKDIQTIDVYLTETVDVSEKIVGKISAQEIADSESHVICGNGEIITDEILRLLIDNGVSRILINKVNYVNSMKDMFSGDRWIASSAPALIMSKSTDDIGTISETLKLISETIPTDYLPDGKAFCAGGEELEIYPNGVYDFSNMYSNTSSRYADLRGISCCMSEENVGSSCYNGKITYESMFEDCGDLKKIDGFIPNYGYTYERMFNNCSSLELDLSKSFIHYRREKPAHCPTMVLSAMYSHNWWWWRGGWVRHPYWYNGYYYPYYYNYYGYYPYNYSYYGYNYYYSNPYYYNYYNYYGYYGSYYYYYNNQYYYPYYYNNYYYYTNYYPYYGGWYNGYYYNYYKYYNTWYGGWYAYPAYYNAWYGYNPYYYGWYGWGSWYRGGWYRSWWHWRGRRNRWNFPVTCAVNSNVVGRTLARPIAFSYYDGSTLKTKSFGAGHVITDEDLNLISRGAVRYVTVYSAYYNRSGYLRNVYIRNGASALDDETLGADLKRHEKLYEKDFTVNDAVGVKETLSSNNIYYVYNYDGTSYQLKRVNSINVGDRISSYPAKKDIYSGKLTTWMEKDRYLTKNDTRDIDSYNAAVSAAGVSQYMINYVTIDWNESEMNGWGVDDGELLNGYNSLTCKNTLYGQMDTLSFTVDGNFELSFYWKCKLPFKNGLIYLIDDTIDYPYSTWEQVERSGDAGNINLSLEGMTLKNPLRYVKMLYPAKYVITNATYVKEELVNHRVTSVFRKNGSSWISTSVKNLANGDIISGSSNGEHAVWSSIYETFFEAEHTFTKNDLDAIRLHNANAVMDGRNGYKVSNVYIHDSERYRICDRRVVASQENVDTWENVQYATNDFLAEGEPPRRHMIRIMTHDNVSYGGYYNIREWCISNISLRLENGRVITTGDFVEHNPEQTLTVLKSTRRELVGKWLAEDVVDGSQNVIEAGTEITEEIFDDKLKYHGHTETLNVTEEISLSATVAVDADIAGEYLYSDVSIDDENYPSGSKIYPSGHKLDESDIEDMYSHGVFTVDIYNDDIIAGRMLAVENTAYPKEFQIPEDEEDVISFIDGCRAASINSITVYGDSLDGRYLATPIPNVYKGGVRYNYYQNKVLSREDAIALAAQSTPITTVEVYAENPLKNDIVAAGSVVKSFESGHQFVQNDFYAISGRTFTSDVVITDRDDESNKIIAFSKGDRITTWRAFDRLAGEKLDEDLYTGRVLIPRGTKISEGHRRILEGKTFPCDIVTGNVVVESSDESGRPLSWYDVYKIYRSGVTEITVKDYGDSEPDERHRGEYMLCEESDEPVPFHAFEDAYHKTTTLDGYEPSSIAYMFNNVKKLYSTKDDFDLSVLVKKTANTVESAGSTPTEKNFSHAFPASIVIATSECIDGLDQLIYDMNGISERTGAVRYCSFNNPTDDVRYGLDSDYMRWAFSNGFIRYGGQLQSNSDYFILVPYYPYKNSAGKVVKLAPWTASGEEKLTPDGFDALFNVSAYYVNHNDWVNGRTDPWNVLKSKTKESSIYRAYNWIQKASLLFGVLVYDINGNFIGKRYAGAWSEGIYINGYHDACRGVYEVTSSRAHPVSIFNGSSVEDIPDVGSSISYDSGKVDYRSAIPKEWYETLLIRR